MNLTNREPIAPLPEPAERVRLRMLFAVTQAELASEMHVTRKTVYAWEHGISEPGGSNRQRYAALLAAWARNENQIATEIKQAGDLIYVPDKPRNSARTSRAYTAP